MPLTWFQIRNEYSLTDPELYREADKDDPEALLEGVAMAGLIGVLRQLGDLAEFAAEVFRDLHDEVMATAARGHGLMVRVQQLEAEFPSIEKSFLSQTSHSSFFHNTGVDWHPNMSMDQNLIAQGDLPRFIMDSYEECRGPPRLFLLDKFDVAGAGSCLKRYTDPSFFKMDSSSSGMMNTEVQREKKTHKGKKKGSGWRNGETSEVLSTSHAKLHQLFMEESVGDRINNPAFHVKLKRRLNGFPFETKAVRSYMEKFLETPIPGDDVAHEISGNSSPLKLPSNVTGESGSDILEISVVDPEKELQQRKRSPGLSPDFEETELKQSMGKLTEEVDSRISGLTKQNPISEADINLPKLHEEVVEKEIVVDEERKIEGSPFGYESDDITSEVENYMDAIATMDSEMETDTECRAKDDLHFLNKNQGLDSDENEEQLNFHAHFSDSQSIGNSIETDEESSSSRKGISTLSYSESLSNLSENTPSDSDVPAKALSSPEICETHIFNTSSNQCCVNGETPLYQSLEYSIFDGLGIEEAVIPNYRLQFEELSSCSFLTDLAPMGLSMEERKSLKVGALVGPGLDEISSLCNEFDIDARSKKMYMVDNSLCVSNLSDVPSQNRDDFFPELSAENHPADEESHVLSHTSLRLSCFSMQASGKNKSENLSDDVLEEKHVEDECNTNSIDNQIGSPISVASHTEEPSQAFLKLEAEIPNYKSEFGEPSSSSHSGYFLSFAEDRKKLTQGALVGQELGESSSRCNELNTPHNHDKEDRMDIGNNLPCMPNLTHMPSQSRNDLSPELCSGNLPAHKLDEEQIDTLQLFSGSLELAPEKKSNENLLDDVLEAEYAVDERLNVSVDSQNDFPLSVASLTEEQPLSSGLPETEICDPDIEPNAIVSEAEFLPFSTEMAINSTSVVDGLQAAYFREQKFPETAENIPHLEPDSIEISPLYYRDKNLYGSSTAAHGDELCGFSSDIDMVGKDASILESPSDFQYSLDSLPVPEIPVHLDDIATDNGHLEALNVATTVTSTHCDDNEGGGKPPSKSPINLLEESISILTDLHENGLRIDEKYSPDHFQDSGIEKEVDQQAIGSSDLDSVMSNAVSYDGLPSEFLDNISDSVVSISRKSLNNNNGPTVSFLSDQKDLDSESKYPINCIENTEDDASSPLHKTAVLWSPSEWKVKFQVDKSNMGSWHSEGTSKQFVQTEQIQSSNHLNYEGSADVSAGHVLNQTPAPEFVQQDVLAKGTDISNQVLPSRSMHPEASQIGLDEMPPLPPLPPVQWRVGKVQHASLAPESNLLQHNLDPLPQVLPHRIDEEDQLGHLAIEGEIIQPSNSYLALSTIKDENSQHADENLAGSSDHFLPSLLLVPIGHGNSEDGFPIPSETQSTNPFLLLPTIFSERSRRLLIVSPVANAEHTISTYPPRSLPDALIQLEQQYALHTISGEGSSVTSEGRVVCPPDISSPPPAMQDNQPQHVVGITGGQTTWPSSTLIPLSPFKDGKPNGNWQMKLHRPQNPLIDAVVAHDKSKLRKVTECVRPQIGQKLDEKDSLLEQIRTKSFNLKPAAASRPSIQAPKTNLKVAAILEKANSIRQALAGSDEDEDGWSDS
ncbi:protein SCAR4-like [Diospyros lotus]|uniref:protein SCAR4-like n=1 Tax=Diospyros lotus TaxID=55363 RepID=UPI002259A07A|nr:protein SCAR4-like [Diospyros lotus]